MQIRVSFRSLLLYSMLEESRAIVIAFQTLFLMNVMWLSQFELTLTFPPSYFCSRYQRKKHADFRHYTAEQEENMLTMLDKVTERLTDGNKTDLLSIAEYKIRP